MEHPTVADSLCLQQVIDAICDEFEEACAARKHPQIETYLNSQPPANRSALFRELLLTELALRPSGDLDATCDNYVARFPQYREIVQHVFRERPRQRFTTVSIRLGARHADLVAAVQSRLAEKWPRSNQLADHSKTIVNTIPNGEFLSGEVLRATEHLWAFLIRHVQFSAPASGEADMQPAAQLEAAASQLLEAFPPLRRRLLVSLLLGSSTRQTASEHSVTERTVAMTYQAAVRLLTAEPS